MSKRIKLIILSVLIVSLGFLRDYIFLNMNQVMDVVMGNSIYHARDEFQFMLDWSISDFFVAKWAGTFIFFGLYLLFTWLIVKVAFENSTYNKITVLVYSGILAVSAVIFGIGYALGHSEEFYGVVHTIMMFGQSFMPLIIFVLLFRFYPKIQEQSTTLNN
jgi:hypothetical protein